MPQQSSRLVTSEYFWRLQKDPQRPDLEAPGVSDPFRVGNSVVVKEILGCVAGDVPDPRVPSDQSLPNTWEDCETPTHQKGNILASSPKDIH